MLSPPEKKDLAEAKSLRTAVRHHDELYYKRARPEVSDHEYDALKRRLASLEKKYPALKKKDSPTQVVGSDISGKFPVRTHRHPMLSLDNTYTMQDLYAYDERIRKNLDTTDYHYNCELKFDGVAISLVYEDGRLQYAATRGDGLSGDEVTENVKRVRKIPLYLKKERGYVEVRGEIFMEEQHFKVLNRKRKKRGEILYANSRNIVAGTLKLKNPAMAVERKLDYFSYEVMKEGGRIDSRSEAMLWLKEKGFRISNTHRLCENIEAAGAYINEWEEKRKNLPMGIDGIVVSVDSKRQQRQLGSTAKAPRWAIAYKYPPKRMTTHIKNVTFQVGRTGAITPVAEVKGVFLDGSLVKKASLYNKKYLEALAPCRGSRVQIEKAGDIIPRIVSLEGEGDGVIIKFTTHCPCCQSRLEERKSIHYCKNRHCHDQIKGRIKHFVQRDALDIKGLGEKNIEALIRNDLIKDPGDLYALDFDTLEGLSMQANDQKRSLQRKSVENILLSIKKSKGKGLAHILFGLGIRNVGKTMAKDLAMHFKSIEALQSASQEVLTAVERVGDETTEGIVKFFRARENSDLLDKLKKSGLSLKTEETRGVLDKLNGLTFVVSGTFDRDREAVKESILLNGGQVRSSLSKKTHYLLVGEKPGRNKKKEAANLGVKIIAEGEFFNLLK